MLQRVLFWCLNKSSIYNLDKYMYQNIHVSKHRIHPHVFESFFSLFVVTVNGTYFIYRVTYKLVKFAVEL